MDKMCINPKTNRTVKIGGPTWRKLVKEGVLDSGEYTDPNVMYEMKKDEEGEDIKKKKVELDMTLPETKQAVIGRGKYKGKLVTRNVQMSPEAMSSYTSKMAAQVMHDNIEMLSQSSDIRKTFEKLLIREMTDSSGGGGRCDNLEPVMLPPPEQYEQEPEDEDTDDEFCW